MVKRGVIAVGLLALGALGWYLTRPPERTTAHRELPAADREPPTLGPTAEARPAAPLPVAPIATRAGDDATKEHARRRYVIHVRGPDGVLAGAEVRVLRGDATEILPRSDEAGTIAVTLASLDDAELAVCKQGYRVESHALYQLDQWDAGGARHLVLEAVPGVPIRGRVIDARTAAPIEGAYGTVNDWGRNPVPIGPTDADGWFTHPGVMDDNEARIRVSAPGYATKEIRVFADSGRLRPEVPILELEPGGRLTGQVLRPDGGPAAGAEVRVAAVDPWDASPEVPPLSAETRADLTRRYQYDDEILERDRDEVCVRSAADGTFVADGLDLGTSYTAVASAVGFAASAETPELHVDPSNVAPTVTLRLRVASRIEVRLVIPDNASLERRPRVRLFHRSAPIKPARGAGTGPYEFEDLVPGRYHVWAQVRGFLPQLDEVVLDEGEARAMDLAIESGAAIEGVVVDEEGHPVAGIEVQAALAVDNPSPRGRFLREERKAVTDEAGRFLIAGLSPGDSVFAAYGYVDGRGWVATRALLRIAAPARGLRVVVKPMGRVVMRLVQPDGTPFSGELWTWLSRGDGGGGGSDDVTDGSYEEGHLDDGDYHLVIAPTGYAWFYRAVTIEDGNTVDWGEIVLGPGATVSGCVVDKDGHPVQGASLTCVLWNQRATQTDTDGRFALDRFPHERLEFRIEAEGFVDTTRALEAGRPGLRVVLQRPAIVEGTLTSARDPIPPDAWIELRPVGAKLITEEFPGPDGTTMEGSYWEGAEELGVDDQGRLHGEVPPGEFDAFWYPEEGDEVCLGRFTFVEGENLDVRMVIPAR